MVEPAGREEPLSASVDVVVLGVAYVPGPVGPDDADGPAVELAVDGPGGGRSAVLEEELVAVAVGDGPLAAPT